MSQRSRAAVRTAALALAALSCTADHGVGPSRPLALQADLGTTPLAAVRISEIHYDNTGTDAGEAIEISGPAGTDLGGWQLVLYNGNGGASYTTTNLTGSIPATCDTRGVVVITYPVNGIQNGSPDGLALVDASGTVVEFLSYEGTFAATSGPALGLQSTDIDVSEAGTEPLGQSLQRNGAGVWSGPRPQTFGTCNDNDEPPPADVVTATVSPATATIVRGGTQQFTAVAFDAANQPIAGVTFTWSSTAPAIAGVSASGLATALTPGDAGIVATAPNGVADTASLHVDAPPGLPDPRFSEIHYDNSGTDVGEAIEIEGPAGTDLTGWSVVLYNGDPASRASYNTRTLTGSIPALCDGRGVVVLSYPANGIQNGSPDGLALVNAGGQVVEFLSYEGTFTALDGPAAGTVSTDIGVSESSSPVGQSLRRDDAGVWSGPAANTFGFCNSSPPPPPANTVTFTGRLTSDPPLPVGFEDQLFATLLDGNGAPVVTTFTWSSETPAIASIDQNGVMRALDAGTAIVRATAAEGTTATFSLPTRVAIASTTALYQGNAEFGEPADADASDDFIVRRAQYTASYNRNRGTPNWVSYDLEATHFGAEDRCDCFTFDPELPAAFTHYTTADYTGAGAFHGYGIDRGHLARSFDRTSGSLDNATTFYFTNIIPQAADLNQGPWAVMENYLGDLARFQNREVYIVAGVAGSKGTVKDEHKIVIPASVWKVAVVVPRDHGLADIHGPQDLEVIAVIMPNDAGVRNVDWETYKTTVDAVEAASGYDLLAALPDGIERIVEANDHFPTASAGGPYAGVEGSAVAFDARGAIDPDGDALGYAWDFGDGATGAGDQPTHGYADNGAYTATVIVTDPYGAADTATASVVVDNLPPTATFVVSGAVTEGDVFPLALVGAFDPSPVDRTSLRFAFDCGDGRGYGPAGGTASAGCPTDDDGLRAVRGMVMDKDGGATPYQGTVPVLNAPPVITGIALPGAPARVATPASVTVTFTDPGTADTHAATIAWGDGGTSVVPGEGSVTASHAYQTPGLYTVTATVRDDDGGTATVTAPGYVVAYDPDAGFVTGGGWITGADGRASFGFEFRYPDGAATPAGTLEFHLNGGGAGLVFTSEQSDWLVLAPGYAKVRGRGSIRGRAGAYAYVLTAVAGDRGGARDGFRLRIWDAAGTVVYDNQPGEPDDSRAATPLAGGSIGAHGR